MSSSRGKVFKVNADVGELVPDPVGVDFVASPRLLDEVGQFAGLAANGYRSKPDGDNVLEAVLDALLAEGKMVAMAAVTKLWIEEGAKPRMDVFQIAS